MWKKEEEQTTTPKIDPRVEPAAGRRGTPSTGTATIGPSIRIDGDVTGSEDLLIQGYVDGSVMLEDHTVSVGKEGRVHADIQGRVITIEGRVEGDLTAQEQIVLRGSAQVKGDIKAPRVVLEDGATFRGLVDMGVADAKTRGGEEGRKGAEAKRSDAGDAPASGTSASSASGSGGGAGKGSQGAKASDSETSDAGAGKKTTQKAGA